MLRGAGRMSRNPHQQAHQDAQNGTDGDVAQTSSLPYRRVPLGQAIEPAGAHTYSTAWQNGILRYSRLEVCATSLVALPRGAWSGAAHSIFTDSVSPLPFHRFNFDSSASSSFNRASTRARSPARKRWNGSAMKSSQMPRHDSAHLMPLMTEDGCRP